MTERDQLVMTPRDLHLGAARKELVEFEQGKLSSAERTERSAPQSCGCLLRRCVIPKEKDLSPGAGPAEVLLVNRPM